MKSETLINESMSVTELREELAKAQADNAQLNGESEAWRDKYKEEYRIVDRVWKALGITSSEQAQPNAIWEHVANLKSTLATYKSAVVEAKAALEYVGCHEHGDNRAYPPTESHKIHRCEFCAKVDSALHTLSALTGDATPHLNGMETTPGPNHPNPPWQA